MIPQQTIEQILQTARIEEVVGEFVNLKKAGSNYKGLSPFTNEKTPSFVVSPAKQIYKCFSSGKGGNCVSFLMELEHFSYPEALKYLAKKYNIEIEERELSSEEIQEANKKESLFIVTGYAQKKFSHYLKETDEGKSVGLSYLKDRGFREETIDKFLLGYCPEAWSSFTDEAIKEGYKLEYLVEAGLTKEKGEKHFDFFRGRVMFPIQNLSGRVVGFGGRTLKSTEKTAKYFNSPESEIYNKSKVLYGIYQAKGAIVKNDNCFLVEGYTDVISLHQAGVENVVASSGTALTHDQIRLIRRYTPNITILYDGDAAGIKASFRGIDLILEEGMNVRVVLFPDGDDPDSYSKKVGSTELEEYIKNNSKDFISFKSEILLAEAAGDPIKRANLIKDLIASIALVPDQITRSVYIRECADRFQMEEATLINELNKLRRSKFKKEFSADVPSLPEENLLPVRKQKGDEDTILHQEQDIVRLLLNYGQYIVKLDVEDEEGDMHEEELTVAEFIVHELEIDSMPIIDAELVKVYNHYKEAIDNNTIPDGNELIHHQDQRISRITVDLITDQYALSGNWEVKHQIYTSQEIQNLERTVAHAVYAYKLKRISTRMKEIQNRLNEIKDETKLLELLSYQNKLNKAKKELSDHLGRTII